MRATAASRRLWAPMALLLCFHVVSAGVVRPLPRQDPFSPSQIASLSVTMAAPSSTVEGASQSTPASDTVTAESGAIASPSTGSSTASAPPSIISASPYVSSNGSSSSVNNSTIPGELPLQPERTPGLFVAAVLLIISGLVHALYANKNHSIYSFFSVAYSVAIGVTMIILLLIRNGVSNSLQGGFVSIVVVAACIVGGCASLKPVACEPFGCLLGTFCLGMWLLTLKESGLLGQNTIKNAAFLSALSVLGPILYFFRSMKDYLMMAASAFAGATALILGIDFVSNAGLKEYWVWIWNLNDSLFPSDASTYPLKMGIKIEQGVTIVIFFAAILVQWSKMKAAKKDRAKQDEEHRKDQVAAQREADKVGLGLVRRIASERSAFEAEFNTSHGPVYQGRGSRTDTFLASIKQGWIFGDTWSKKHAKSRINELAPQEAKEVAGDPHLEDSDAHKTSIYPDFEERSRMSVNTRHDSCNTGGRDRDSGITVTRDSLAPDQQEIGTDGSRPATPSKTTTSHEQMVEMNESKPTTSSQPTEPAMAAASGEETGRMTIHIAEDEVELAAAARAAQNPVPEVVPLPFTLPTSKNEVDDDDKDDDDDDSSLAVMTDAFRDNEVLETRSIGSKRSSVANRLSKDSVDLSRKLSQYSSSRNVANQTMDDIEGNKDLAAPRRCGRESVAAAYDDMSSVDTNDLPAAASETMERLSSGKLEAESADDAKDAIAVDSGKTSGVALKETVKDSPDPLAIETLDTRSNGQEADAAQVDDKASLDATESSKRRKGGYVESVASDPTLPSGAARSNDADALNRPFTLETGQLDTRVSAAARTYRMVEWVKHQTQAEAPEMDDLNVPELCDRAPPRAVDVDDLMKTAVDGAPEVAKPRTASAIQSRAHMSSTQQHRPAQARHSSHRQHERAGSMSSEQTRQAAISATAAALAGRAMDQASPAPSQHSRTAEMLRSRPPVPGIKACNAPQSLVAKRETMMRMKQQALRPHSQQAAQAATLGPLVNNNFAEASGGATAPGSPDLTRGPNSEPSSRRTSGTYRSPNVSSVHFGDVQNDSMTMRQRQALIRDPRTPMSPSPSSATGAGSDGSSSRRHASVPATMGVSKSAPFPANSPIGHHPQRSPFHASSYQNQTREAQLAGLRSPAPSDPRASTQSSTVASPLQQPGYGGSYFPTSMAAMMNGPLINNVYHAIPGTSSSNSLLPQQTQAWNSEVSRDLDVHRQAIMAQQGADGQRRESSRRAERARQSQLRGQSAGMGQMMDTHSEMMARLQRKAQRHLDDPGKGAS